MRQYISIIAIAWLSLAYSYAQNEKHLVVLHVNDTHSRIEPMPANATRNADKGGQARLAAYVESVRDEHKSVLFFHAGDIVQGTPYFNMFKGEPEIALLNRMKVDAACLGNHEFDYGYPVLKEIIKQAKFPFVASNFDFSATPLKGMTKPYLILKRNGVKIGILGLGPELDGLVAKQNYAGTVFLPPIETANKVAAFLKQQKKCDLVICLSHLGYSSTVKDNDILLAQQSRNIDLIIGGHSHTFLEKPDRQRNLDGKEVVISQMGGSGIHAGRLDVSLNQVKQ
ncbi:MAG: metallophosphatase [Dysgonamonadaceae bacterium]|jgi:5'-nucleotidase|nr:metallophosphatase [Dysgonamonadaceae bacterium]